jgi:hypothetical protein
VASAQNILPAAMHQCSGSFLLLLSCRVTSYSNASEHFCLSAAAHNSVMMPLFVLLLLLLLSCRVRQWVASCSSVSAHSGRLGGLRSQHGDEET